MLKFGRYNNVVQWREDMQNEACGLYGMTGTFYTTNKSSVHLYPREEDYNPTFLTVEIDTRQRVSKTKTRKTRCWHD